MHVAKIENLQTAENHEDGSEFDEIRTKKIAASEALSCKTNARTNEKFPKNSKTYRKQIRKILRIDTADVINY